MVSDVMHLEINDSVFNNFVGRHFPYTLWDQGTFVLALVVGIVFLNVAAHRPSQVPPSVSWARAAGKAGVRSAKEPGDKWLILFLLQEQPVGNAVEQGTYI